MLIRATGGAVFGAVMADTGLAARLAADRSATDDDPGGSAATESSAIACFDADSGVDTALLNAW
jgi:hypothetical protein